MRCTCGKQHLGSRDRPCNQPLTTIAFYSLKNRTVEHETPVHVCPYCDALKAWPNPEQEDQ